MFGLGQAMQQIADDISSLGVPAVVDARDLNLPGAWVTPGPFAYEFMSKTALTLSADVYLISRDLPAVQAEDDLGNMVDVLAGPLHISAVTPQTVTLPNHGADPLPALYFRLDNLVIRDTTQ
jgi:hypothetical protein